MTNLENLGVQEMNTRELTDNNGGFIPLVILGVAYTAGQVAAGTGLLFTAGVAIGALVASSQSK